jgi:hypothetical protein
VICIRLLLPLQQAFSDRIPFIFFDNDLNSVFAAVIRVRPYCIAAFDDTILNVSIVPKVHIVQDDGILDHTIVAYIYVFKEDRIFNLSINDTTT